MKWLLEHVSQDSSLAGIYAHTEVSNKPILAMAEKMSFEIIGLVQDYYAAPANPNAYVLCWCKAGHRPKHPLQISLFNQLLRDRYKGGNRASSVGQEAPQQQNLADPSEEDTRGANRIAEPSNSSAIVSQRIVVEPTVDARHLTSEGGTSGGDSPISAASWELVER